MKPSKPNIHRIMGPPGTGKSTHLAHLVKEISLTESNVAVVSFTRAAAGVLMSRCPSHSLRFVGTLHALAFRTLGLTKGQVANDEAFVKWYGSGMEEMNIAMSVYRYAYHNLCSLPDAYAYINPPIPFMKLEHVVSSYGNWVDAYKYITFDNMIELATGNIEPFDVVVVDEAQDLTNKQWDMVLSMIKPNGKMIIAGDDDQAVYTWSGANPHAMAELATTSEVLGQSYRIPASVHRFAENLVKRINKRSDKEYLPRSEEGTVEFVSHYDPAFYPGKHTILCRDKWSMKDIEDQLISRALPYTCASHLSMYDRGRAKTIRAIINEDFTSIKRLSKFLHKEYHEDPILAVKHSWKRCVNLGTYDVESSYLHLLNHEAEPLIHLSTIHGAKGEEDNHIVLIGQCTGITEMAMDNIDRYDDELRVWYVGATRAKETLTVVGWNQYIQ